MSAMVIPLPIASRLDTTGDCWEWGGAHTTAGYSSTHLDGKLVYVHRVMYELFMGPIPAGLQIDHLCRNRGCVNPAHLEAVTQLENVRRGNSGAWQRAKTHCRQGHEFTPENTRLNRNRSGFSRVCRTCTRAWGRARDAKRRKERAA